MPNRQTLSRSMASLAAMLLLLALLEQAAALNLTVGPTDGDVVGSDNFAIQKAVDYVAKEGGGSVFVKSGTYCMYNALYLRTGVDVVGVGPAPVLQKANGFKTKLAEDAGYANDKIVVEDASGLQAGMGISFLDDANTSGWYVNVRTITKVDGKTLTLDEGLDLDYLIARNARITTAGPVIFGKQVKVVRVENLIADGNRSANEPMDGCRGAAIYFWKSDHCSVVSCTARNYNGDGFSYQVSPYVTLSRCKSYRNSALGVHPGSGSEHTEVSGCEVYDNDGAGLFLDWRVRDSLFTDNQIQKNGLDGISIGHKDTDNHFVGNTLERNGRHGVYFRAETEANGGHRTTLENNVIRDNGQTARGDGIHIEAATHDITIRGNTIEDTGRDGRVTQQNGIYLGKGVDGVQTRGNTIGGHPGEVIVDQSGGLRNSLQF